MSGPYRELFVELGDELLALARGMAEAAVAAAKPSTFSTPRLGPVGRLAQALTDDGMLHQWMLRHLGACVVAASREPLDTRLSVRARWSCGHRVEVSVSELVVYHGPGQALEAIVDEFDRMGRPCFCMHEERR